MTAVAVAAEYLEVWRTEDGKSAAFESVYRDGSVRRALS